MYAGFNNDQEMLLYASGVPFDRVYLDDILKNERFQQYKVYVFLQNTYISQEQRQQISQLLKNNGRTLVWVYDSGYISENGKSVEGMAELTGIKINTKEVFQRTTPLVIAGSHPLANGVLPFQSASELQMANFKLAGFDAAMAPGQPFWIDDPAATVFAKYQEDGLNAMVVKDLGTWKSIYLGGAGSLGDDLLNNIAKSANAYTVSDAGIAEIHTNGTFISIHALRSGEYTIQLPPGKTQVLEAETGKVLQQNGKTYLLKLEAQKTYWFLFK